MQVFFLVLVCLVVNGCAPPTSGLSAASPTSPTPENVHPVAQATPPPPGPTGRAAALANIARANKLLRSDEVRHWQDEVKRWQEIVQQIQEAVRQYLQEAGDIALLAHDPPRQADLADVLTLVAADSPPSRPTVVVHPFGGVPVLLVAYADLPRRLDRVPLLLAFHGAGAALQVQQLSAMDVHRIVDVTGDGQEELVLTGKIEGASSFHHMLSIFGWEGNHFVPLFQGSVGDWGGSAGWRLEPHGAGYDAVLWCPALGPFDNKFLAHPTLTHTYRWDGARFVLAQASLPPPTTRHDAFNRAEVAFRWGDLSAALAGYRTVVEDSSLRVDPQATADWPALAWLRIGQAQALLGNLVAARESLEQAVQAGGEVGLLAEAFRDALAQPEGLARAFVAAGHAVQGRLGPGTFADHFGVPGDHADLLPVGLALGAHLEAHPEQATASTEALRAAFHGLGVAVAELTRADLDGDGQDELVALLDTRYGSVIWIVTRDEGHWRALRANDAPTSPYRLGAVEPAPDGVGHVVALLATDGRHEPLGFIGLRDGRPRRYDSVRNPLPSTGAAQCSLAEGLRSP
jgi:hypothetical protein